MVRLKYECSVGIAVGMKIPLAWLPLKEPRGMGQKKET